MHHYPFHPGDYMLSTAHLSLEADAVYRRCLDHYYDAERPLASAKQTLSVRLRVPEHLLSEVLAEFFVETPEGWRHERCDAEIERYKSKSAKAKKAGSLGGKAKSSKRLANAKRTPSKRLANASNQELELEPIIEDSRETRSQLSDDEWLNALSADPTYAGIDVRNEFGKMTRWCEANRKLPSRKRFVNWLNRAEKPISTHHANTRHTSPRSDTANQPGRYA